MTSEATPRLRRASSRALSLLLAIPLSLILLIHPITILNAQGHYNHNLLMLVMWGVAAGMCTAWVSTRVHACGKWCFIRWWPGV